MNSALLHTHNLLRWGVLIAGLLAIYLAYTGISNKRAWETKDNKAGMWFVLFCHLQLVLGLVLYFMMDKQSIFSNMAEGMKDPYTRYWGMEHLLGMIIAIAVVQFGRIASKKAGNDLLKHKKALIWYGVAMLLFVINIPWPWKTVARGLFPGM
jgi:hypothetical protein